MARGVVKVLDEWNAWILVVLIAAAVAVMAG